MVVPTCRLILEQPERDVRRIRRNKISIDAVRDNRGNPAPPLREAGSFDRKRKTFGLFFGPLGGSLFHKSLHRFFLVLFLTVLAFAHFSHSF